MHLSYKRLPLRHSEASASELGRCKHISYSSSASSRRNYARVLFCGGSSVACRHSMSSSLRAVQLISSKFSMRMIRDSISRS
jgi:hypothetical protein